MSEIDEELGRYLDALVEPVEPEWVIGWVAQRRRRRAAVVLVGAFVVAGAAGSLGYALHTPGPTSSVHFGSDASSTSTSVATSTSVPESSTAPSTTARPTPPAPRQEPTTTSTTAPAFPWPVKSLAPADVTASLQFATDTFVSGASVDATVTLVNQTDEGVIIRDQLETDVAIIANGQLMTGCDPQLFYPAIPGGAPGVLPPHAAVTATCPFVLGDPGPTTVVVGLQNMMVPFTAAFTETAVQIDVSPAPTTTTTTAAG